MCLVYHIKRFDYNNAVGFCRGNFSGADSQVFKIKKVLTQKNENPKIQYLIFYLLSKDCDTIDNLIP